MARKGQELVHTAREEPANPAGKRRGANKETDPPFQELLSPKTEHELLFHDLCRQLLMYEPQRRFTASEALKHPFFSKEIS